MRRRAVLTGSAALAVAVSTGAGWWLRDSPALPVAAEVPTGTTTIVRTDLATTTTIPGTLGFTGTYEVYGGRPGTVTWLPRPGQVVDRGHPVYAVDNRQVRLLFADRPAWRDLSAGVTAGPDVQAAEANLVALGHAADLTVDGTFTRATAAALRRWQYATGQPVTGRLERGAVTFQPGPLRVTTVTAKVGAPADGSGPVLSGTSTTVGVTLAVPVDRMHLVHPRDTVTVTLPDGAKVAGTVTAVSTVASPPTGDDFGRQGLATVPATVTLDTPATAAALDQAPVQVDVVGEKVTGVLAVPVTALVALSGGGYGLYLVESGARRLVGVTPGLFSDTLVEVAGPDLREGAAVEVPAT